MTFTLGLVLVIFLSLLLSFLGTKFASGMGLGARATVIGLLIGWIPFVKTLQFISMAGIASYIFLVLGFLFYAFVIAWPVAYFFGRWLEVRD